MTAVLCKFCKDPIPVVKKSQYATGRRYCDDRCKRRYYKKHRRSPRLFCAAMGCNNSLPVDANPKRMFCCTPCKRAEENRRYREKRASGHLCSKCKVVMRDVTRNVCSRCRKKASPRVVGQTGPADPGKVLAELRSPVVACVGLESDATCGASVAGGAVVFLDGVRTVVCPSCERKYIRAKESERAESGWLTRYDAMID